MVVSLKLLAAWLFGQQREPDDAGGTAGSPLGASAFARALSLGHHPFGDAALAIPSSTASLASETRDYAFSQRYKLALGAVNKAL